MIRSDDAKTEVAIKLFFEQIILNYFLREAKIIKELNHENIVHVFLI